MFERDERRLRHRECLELEASYGQFLPCESHGEAEDMWADALPADERPLAERLWTAVMQALRAARSLLRRSGLAP